MQIPYYQHYWYVGKNSDATSPIKYQISDHGDATMAVSVIPTLRPLRLFPYFVLWVQSTAGSGQCLMAHFFLGETGSYFIGNMFVDVLQLLRINSLKLKNSCC